LRKDILKQRTNNIELKHHCVNLLKQYGSLAHTKNILEELNAKARAEIDRLGGNPFLTKILDDSEKMDRGKNLIL
jgi:geranylgeranyl diphosphate synthase type 3